MEIIKRYNRRKVEVSEIYMIFVFLKVCCVGEVCKREEKGKKGERWEKKKKGGGGGEGGRVGSWFAFLFYFRLV